MPYESVGEAIRRRFSESRTPAGIALGRDPFPGQAPTDMFRGGACAPRAPGQNDQALLRTRVGGHLMGVPVFEWDRGGQDVDVFPAITYKFLRERFRGENYHPGETIEECLGETCQHDSRTGEVRTGPNMLVTRAHPEPISTYWELKVWADDNKVACLILEEVKRHFPARRNAFLTVTERDGGKCQLDFFRVSGPNNESVNDPTVQGDQSDPGTRLYAYTMTYELEGYEDNTLETVRCPTILQRFQEIGPMEDDGEGTAVTFDAPGVP